MAQPPAQPGAPAVAAVPQPVSTPPPAAPAVVAVPQQASTAPAATPAVTAVQQPASIPPSAVAPLNATVFDGFYAGAICFDKSANFPAACIHGEATVSHGGISGRWPGPKQGVTWFVSGVVAASGDARIELHSQKMDGQRIATINLTGIIRAGQLNATGHFLNGRPATLNWHRN